MNRVAKHIIFSVIVFSLVTIVPAFAQLGLEETAGRAGLFKAGAKNKTVLEILGNIISAGLSLTSIVFFSFIVFAGFRWMFARGNEQTIEKAQDTIIHSIIGILIVLSAYAITSFLFDRLSKDKAPFTSDPTETSCTVYKSIDSDFACVAANKCDGSVVVSVQNAHAKKKVGSLQSGGKYISGICKAANTVCCLPKL
jgi:hypothetical protein